MDPKFVTLDDAAQQLNISADQLNALREQGKLRAYRDGSSWKFRSEEIDRMVSEGVPAIDEESGINLDLDDLSLGSDLSLDDADFGGTSDIDSVSFSDINLDDDESELGLSTGSSADVSLNLDDEPATPDEPSSPAESTEEVAELDIEPELELDLESEAESVVEEVAEAEEGDPESILLSESDLEDNSGRPPSTIIGRNESKEDDALDLDVVSEGGSDEAAYSDVKLADMDDFDIDDMAAATLKAESAESLGGDFENIDELELDLEAESSRILTPDDVAAAQAAAGSQAQEKSPETSDLELELDDDYTLAGSDVGVADTPGDQAAGSELDLDMGSSAGSGGLTGISALELDDDSDDDDFVLGDGSDVTLSPGDSGINLSPADSGLSLDDAALDLGGSAIGSGIDFGEASGLISDGVEGDFELTPMEEDAGADDEDDSSQVIALDAFEDNQEAEDLLGASSEPMADMGMAPAPAAGFAQTAVVPQAEVQFTTWQVVFLSLCLVLLSLCGMMTLDVVRSMWSWGEPYAVNSSLIDSLSGFLFP